jgi:hypothetical protein
MFDMSQKPVPPKDQLKKMIWDSMDNACSNGYAEFMKNGDLEEIANDLHDCDADLEGIDPANFEEHILSWREAHK